MKTPEHLPEHPADRPQEVPAQQQEDQPERQPQPVPSPEQEVVSARVSVIERTRSALEALSRRLPKIEGARQEFVA